MALTSHKFRKFREFSLFVSAFAFAFAFAGNSPPGSPQDLAGNSPPAPLFLSCDLWYANDLLKRGVYDLTN